MNKSKVIFAALWPDKCWHVFTNKWDFDNQSVFCDKCGVSQYQVANPDYFADTPQGAYDREKMWARAQEMEWWEDYTFQFDVAKPRCPSRLFMELNHPTDGPQALYEYLIGRE